MKKQAKLFVMLLCVCSTFSISAQNQLDSSYVRECILSSVENAVDRIGMEFEKTDTVAKFFWYSDIQRLQMLTAFQLNGRDRYLFNYYVTYFTPEAPHSYSYAGMCDTEGNILWVAQQRDLNFTFKPQHYHPDASFFLADAMLGEGQEHYQYVVLDEKGNILVMEEELATPYHLSLEGNFIVECRNPMHIGGLYSVACRNFQNGIQWEKFFPDAMPLVQAIHPQGDYLLLKTRDSLLCLDGGGKTVFTRPLPGPGNRWYTTSTFQTFLEIDQEGMMANIYGPEMKEVLATIPLEKPFTKQLLGFDFYSSPGSDYYLINVANGRDQAHFLLIDPKQKVIGRFDKTKLGGGPYSGLKLVYEAKTDNLKIYNGKMKLIHETKGRNDGTDKQIQKSD